MNLNTQYDIYSIIRGDKLSFIYQGAFSDDMTEMITNLSEFNMSKSDEGKSLKKKVFYLMVESFQNIIRHGQNTKTTAKKMGNKAGIFITRNVGNAYYISSANLIKNEEVASTRKKLLSVNELDSTQLKALYMDILANDSLSSKGGAGLGLIEMARKSGQKLEYDFKKVDDKYSFFYLQIKIVNPNANSEDHEKLDFHSLKTAKDIHDIMLKENILLVHHGDFSKGSILPLLKLIRDNLDHQSAGISMKKKITFILIELMQNISKHGKTEDGRASGILLMGKKTDKYLLGTGNMIDRGWIQKLKDHLEMLNAMPVEELNNLYKTILRNGEASEDGGAGLGLIEIARASEDKLTYDFADEDENTLFYSLIARL